MRSTIRVPEERSSATRPYPPNVPVRQYAYFALVSHSTPAAEVTAILGIEPDRTVVRGSRRTKPTAIPVVHRWIVECREPGLSVDKQITRILERLAPHTDAIADLAQRLKAEVDGGSGAVLEVVRYFNEAALRSSDDSENALESAAEGPLGWHLGRDVLDFLQATGTVLDVDEYDMSS